MYDVSMYHIQIQLSAVTSNESRTDPTKSFSLSAIGSSGNFSCKLGDQIYKVRYHILSDGACAIDL